MIEGLRNRGNRFTFTRRSPRQREGPRRAAHVFASALSGDVRPVAKRDFRIARKTRERERGRYADPLWDVIRFRNHTHNNGARARPPAAPYRGHVTDSPNAVCRRVLSVSAVRFPTDWYAHQIAVLFSSFCPHSLRFDAAMRDLSSHFPKIICCGDIAGLERDSDKQTLNLGFGGRAGSILVSVGVHLSQ